MVTKNNPVTITPVIFTREADARANARAKMKFFPLFDARPSRERNKNEYKYSSNDPYEIIVEST